MRARTAFLLDVDPVVYGGSGCLLLGMGDSSEIPPQRPITFALLRSVQSRCGVAPPRVRAYSSWYS
eukprot:7309567-Prymnesium_polylepis.2